MPIPAKSDTKSNNGRTDHPTSAASSTRTTFSGPSASSTVPPGSVGIGGQARTGSVAAQMGGVSFGLSGPTAGVDAHINPQTGAGALGAGASLFTAEARYGRYAAGLSPGRGFSASTTQAPDGTFNNSVSGGPITLSFPTQEAPAVTAGRGLQRAFHTQEAMSDHHDPFSGA